MIEWLVSGMFLVSTIGTMAWAMTNAGHRTAEVSVIVMGFGLLICMGLSIWAMNLVAR